MIEFLKNAFGEAVTDEVISDFKSELGKKFVAKADYNAKRDELKNIQAEFEELKARHGDAQAASAELSQLKAKYDEDIAALNQQLERVHIDNEVGAIIRKHGGKNEKALKALLDLSGDDIINSIGNQLDSIKQSDPYLFDLPAPGGAKGNFPRESSAKGTPLTYSQMMANMKNI